MSRKFQVEIFALAVGASSHNEMGMVYHELEIDSESNMLRLPIQACILLYNLFMDSIIICGIALIFL